MFFLRSVKTILISAVIVDYIMPLLPTYTGEPILAAIFGGILAGAGLAFIYMRDSSTGGSDFVILAIREKESPAFNREHIPRRRRCYHYARLDRLRQHETLSCTA